MNYFILNFLGDGQNTNLDNLSFEIRKNNCDAECGFEHLDK